MNSTPIGRLEKTSEVFLKLPKPWRQFYGVSAERRRVEPPRMVSHPSPHKKQGRFIEYTPIRQACMPNNRVGECAHPCVSRAATWLPITMIFPLAAGGQICSPMTPISKLSLLW